MGSLAGAAHLIKDNTGVLRLAHDEQKSSVESKVKSLSLICLFSLSVRIQNVKAWPNDPLYTN